MRFAKPFASFLTACTLAALPLVAHADSLQPDTSYGTLGNGAVIDSDAGPTNSIVVLSTNKLLVANPFTFGFSKYGLNGSLETLFGTGGRATTTFSTTGGSVRALAVQADGKILAGGSAPTASTSGQSALARFTSSGALDTTFANGGKTTFNTGDATAQGEINFVGIQSDGKIVTAGLSGDQGVLARFNADGSPDRAFGSYGRVVVVLGAGAQTTNGFVSLAFQADGKILTTGYRSSTGGMAMFRYNPDGSPDTTFGTNGAVYDSFAVIVPHALGLINGAGKITVVGQSSYQSLAYARYNSDGTLDTTFGTGGQVITTSAPAGNSSANTFRFLSGGKILVAGYAGRYGLIARVNLDGTPDTTFNGSGYYTSLVDARSTSYGVWNALGFQGDGKIITAGSIFRLGSDVNLAIQRTIPITSAGDPAPMTSSAPNS